MATFDEMLVRLLFDTSDLEKGAKQAMATVEKTATDLVASAEKGEKAQTGALSAIVQGWNAMVAANRRAAEASAQSSKAMVSSTEKLAESGERAIRTFGALFLMFAGARSVKDFASDMLGVDAALGRTARSIGQTPETLSGIGRAVERMGGTFDGAVGGLKGLSDAFQQLKTTGNSSIMEPLARLQGLSGKRIALGPDVRANFYSIADALKAEADRGPQGAAMADYLGRQILGDEGLVNLAKQGGAAARAQEAASPKVTREQTEQAQKLQAQLAAVRQSFQDIGNSILMDFGPAMLRGIGWVKDLIEANRGLIETKVKEWVAEVGQWFADHKGDIENFGRAVGALATAAGSLATAFASQSPAMQAMEAFGALAGGTLLRSVTGLSGALGALFALPAPAWFLALNPATLGTVAVGAVLASGDPNKSVLDGGRPDVQPQDNDTGLPGVDTRPSDTSDARGKTSGAWAWFTDTMKKLGFGDRLHDDPKTKDDISDTAKSTKGILDVLKDKLDSLFGGTGGVTQSSGGLGGSGQHSGGGSFPGASLGDHARGGIGRNAAQMEAGARESFNFWLSKGLTREQAAGLVGMEQGESQFNPRIVGDHGEAHGAFQWHADRRARILAATGINIDNATHAQQLEAAYWEFTHTHQAAWNAVRQGKTASDAARSGVYLFEAPKDKAGQSIVRGGMGEGWLKRFDDEDAKKKSSPTAMAPAPAGTTERAIGDAEAFAAEQRLRSGGNDPRDRALVKRYHQQQNAPATAQGAHSPAPTVGQAIRHVLGVMAHANALTRHGGAVPVDITERGANRIAHPLNEALRHRAVGAGRAHFNHDIERAAHQAAAYRGLHRMAIAAAYSSHVIHNVDRSTETTVNGGIHVHTRATDARGIAADIEPHLHRGQAAGRADYGLA